MCMWVEHGEVVFVSLSHQSCYIFVFGLDGRLTNFLKYVLCFATTSKRLWDPIWFIAPIIYACLQMCAFFYYFF